MKGRLKFVVPLVLLALLGGAYKTVLAKPAEEPEPRIAGQVYVLPKEFLLNTSDDRYAKLWVALVLPHDEVIGGEAHAGAVEPPEGFGPLHQEAIVRSIVTDVVGAASSRDLTDPQGRERVERRVLRAIRRQTDVHAEDVVFTDVAVQ